MKRLYGTAISTFLGYTENEECCMRIVDNKIASEIESEVLKL